MYKEQLMKAFQLMKEGEKGQAGVIVKGVLREDPKNLNAWWLMSNLLEDEDKQVKALERVLAIDPNHKVARQRLSQLRPEYSNLAPEKSAPAKKTDAAHDAAYWSKLNNAPQAPKSNASSAIMQFVFSRMGLRLIIFVVVVLFGSVSAFITNIESENALPDINGNTPQDAIETFLRATIVEDRAALYDITCPEIRAYADSIVADFIGGTYTVDFSNTIFELEHHDYRNDRAYVTLNGSAVITGDGLSTTVDWREAAAADGYDFFGEFAQKVNGRWLVCEEYNVPNVETHD